MSNGRITDHEQAIHELQIRTSAFQVQLDQVQDERAAQRENQRRYRMAMFERLLWLLAAVVLAAIVRYTGL